MNFRIFHKDFPDFGEDPVNFLKGRIDRGKDSFYDSDPQHIEAKLERTQTAVAMILALMRDKGLITDDEMLEAVGIDRREQEKGQISIRSEKP